MPRIRFVQIFADPSLDIGDLRPLISGDSFASRKLREADAEARVVHILFDHVVACTRQRRILEKLQERLAGVGPSSLVSVHK